MKLLDTKIVSFENVLSNYRKENGVKNDLWEIRTLERANEKFGNWIFSKLNSSEIGEIILPHYSFGGVEIVPFRGLSLEDAYLNFVKNEDFYKKNNAQFYDRVEFQKDCIVRNGRVKTIYLSEEPLFLGKSYSGLKNFKNKITHLDGLHRLFALMDLEDKPKFIENYMARY